MLVLTRKVNERVTIRTPSGEVVVVTVTRVDGDKVRLGFEAPRATTITRNELLPETPGERE